MIGQGLAAIAWRNIWRNRRRTIITLFGISFGVFLAVLFTGVGDSMYSTMIDHSAKLASGHVVVQHQGYQDLPTLKKSVTGTRALRDAAEAKPGVTKTVARISGAALVATASASQGAFFMAVDPTEEDATTMAILDSVVEGVMLDSPDDKGVVLGRKLANALGVTMGKKLVYTLTDRQGEIVSGLARVKGIVETGAPTVDGNLCLLSVGAVRTLLGYADDEATHVAIFVGDNRDSDAVAIAMRGEVSGTATVMTWAEASPDLAGFIQMKVASTWVFEMIIMVLLAAGIFNTLFVSVMERMREFGIMAAVGFTAGTLFRLVMWESLWLALVGLVVAGIVTAFPYYHLNTVGFDYGAMVGEGAEVAGVALDPTLYVAIYGSNLAIIATAVVVATLLSGVYPAWRAGRTNPADVIRLQ